MARIAGVDIPNDKRVVISLTYVYKVSDFQHLRKSLLLQAFLKIFVFVILHQIKKMLSVVKLTQSKLKVTFVVK